MGDWTQVGENLVKHRGGTIYLRAKVAGKVIRRSLGTSSLKIAKLKRDDLLLAARTAAAKSETTSIRTLGDALNAAADAVLTQPHLKQATAKYYRDLFSIMRKTMPVEVLARTWTPKEAAGWWKKVAAEYSGQRANNLLACARRATALMMEAGIRLDDPLAGLRRVRIGKPHHDVPSRETMLEIIESIRSQGKRASEESANYVAFLAFSGCRHGEAAAVRWEDIGEQWLVVTGGDKGTKNSEVRRVPISDPLRDVIERMRYPAATGPVFSIRSPRLALENACKRLGLPHMRLHDLRHFFATLAVEKGVDVATVAKWLGHKDGGVLVLKTYGHARDDHSLSQAAKL